MIQLLSDLNTKSAVLYMIIWMVLFNAAFTAGIVGMFFLIHWDKIEKLKEDLKKRD